MSLKFTFHDSLEARDVQSKKVMVVMVIEAEVPNFIQACRCTFSYNIELLFIHFKLQLIVSLF